MPASSCPTTPWSAAVGPQMSGAGKAMAPILSQGDLAIITPSATNPDLTDPKFAAQYRPAGKAVFFRTVTTDAFQGPNMADFFAEKLGAKAIYILDDQGAYGVGLADAFQKRIDGARASRCSAVTSSTPRTPTIRAILTKIKSLNADSLYYGGVGTAGVKLIKQSYEILPNMKKGGGDGLYGADIAEGRRVPRDARAGTPPSPRRTWYRMTRSSPVDQAVQGQVQLCVPRTTPSPPTMGGPVHHRRRWRKVAATGKPMTRGCRARRDQQHPASSPTLQGPVSVRRQRRHREQDRQRVPVPKGRQARRSTM